METIQGNTRVSKDECNNLVNCIKISVMKDGPGFYSWSSFDNRSFDNFDQFLNQSSKSDVIDAQN